MASTDVYLFFFFQAEDGIRDLTVTGVQTCALPILPIPPGGGPDLVGRLIAARLSETLGQPVVVENRVGGNGVVAGGAVEVGRAACRGRGEISGGGGSLKKKRDVKIGVSVEAIMSSW